MDLKKIFEGVPADCKKLGVVGWPVDHSLSPAMHEAAIQALGLNAVYRKIGVDPGEWKGFLEQCRSLPLDGFNVTVPYKEKVDLDFPGLQYDDERHAAGSINTLVRRGGEWSGYSTDGDGFLKDAEYQELILRRKNVCVLGAGGSARALLFALGRSEAQPAKVTLINRSHGRAELLLQDFIETTEEASFPLSLALSDAEKKDAVRKADVLINATSIGLRPGEGHVIDFSWLHPGLTVYDLVYHRETELLRAAKKTKARALGGMGMLVQQGAIAFEIWFGQKPPIDVMMKAAKEEMKRRTSS